LKDLDIPDLCRMISPKEQLWINPVNHLSEIMNKDKVLKYLGNINGLQVSTNLKRRY
jgi:hypothetical protein